MAAAGTHPSLVRAVDPSIEPSSDWQHYRGRTANLVRQGSGPTGSRKAVDCLIARVGPAHAGWALTTALLLDIVRRSCEQIHIMRRGKRSSSNRCQPPPLPTDPPDRLNDPRAPGPPRHLIKGKDPIHARAQPRPLSRLDQPFDTPSQC